MKKNSELMKWPKFLLIHNKLQWIYDRDKAVLLSVVILYYSYFYASLLELPSIFSSSGSMVSAIGLLLTLKHGVLSSMKNPKEAVSKRNLFGRISSIDMMEIPDVVNPTIIALKDEYVGILLVLLGGIISGYGSFVPLLSGGT
ncbi:TPA: hypothetical protein ACPJ06_003969 [Vibrio diabolicus]|uniref:hypothetical protein n=2 Tax=Vibrionaceae TaxID=641 RepID=UPI00215BFC6E|nr:hypothetical protein [Vibrio alginolyticus]